MLQNIELKTLKTIISTQLAVESMDEIKGTVIYKGKAKQHGNMYINVVNPLLKETIINVYKEDPELTTNLFRELDALVTVLAKLNLVDLVMIKQIHHHYSKFPEDWQNFYTLQFTKLNQ